MEEEIEIKDGKQKTSIKKVFPGYVLVKMIMEDETWYAVKNIKGVFNFVGVGDKPLPLTEKEMQTLGIDNVIKTFRDSQPEYEAVNKIDRRPSIIASLGMIYFLLFISAAGSCGFLLEDERDGTKDRILMGKISERKYYVAQCIVFFIFRK